MTLDEAEKRLNEELVKIITQPKATKELLDKYSHIVSIYLKITRQRYAEDHKRVTDNTLKTNEKKRTKEEIKQDEKALKALGEETYNKAYRYAVYILRKDEATRESAFESALIFSKMSQAFKKNYGIDIPIPIMVSKKAEEKDGFITLGVYKPKENGLVISKGHRNASTLIHEGTHWYEEMLKQFSSLSDDEIETYFKGNKAEAKKAIANMKEDLKVIDDWAGFSEEKLNDYIGTGLEREFKGYVELIHSSNTGEALKGLNKFRSERLARGFEKFLIDGKAKSNGLKAVFERIKNFMIAIIKGNKDIKEQEIAKHELPKEIQDLYDSMINGNRNEKAGIDETSTDNGKVNSNEESNVPHKTGTISSDTIRESLSEPLYQVTNRELSADDKVEVVDITGSPRINALRDNDGGKELIKSLEGKEFSFIGGTGYVSWIDKGALKGENKRSGHEFIHSDLKSKDAITDETRERALTNSEKIFNNCVYVDKHPDYRHQKGTDYIELFCPVKDGNEIYCVHLVARERDNEAGRYKVGKALFYNLYKNKKPLPHGLLENPTNINGGNGFYKITIADLLNGVKDKKGNPYVINGELNYDENIFMTKEMLEDKIQKEKFMKDMETSVVNKFPNVKNVSSTVTHVTFDMPNGSHIDMNTYRDKIYIKPDANSENVDVVNREDLLKGQGKREDTRSRQGQRP